MNVEAIEELMGRHNLLGLYQGGAANARVREEPKKWVLEFGDLPQLTFFMELAELCRVPLQDIKMESEEHYGGCDTCGYGAGTEITVYVPRLTR